MVQNFGLICCCFLFLAGCGSAPAVPSAAAAKPAPTDESRRLPAADRLSQQLVLDHLLDKPFLPGGNLAEYELNGKRYQVFLLRAPDAPRAGLLLFDLKGSLQGAKFVPHMGAYYGQDSGRAVYAFSKGPFVAGYLGLTEAEAEPLARVLAARL